MSGEVEWEEVLRAAAALQKLVPDAVLVGGTAAAIHAHHRRSSDADHVLTDLQSRFDQLVAFLEGQADWTTARLQAPNLILGSFKGVETGLRQLVRARPLETELVAVGGVHVRVPTAAEMLRIKGWLIVRRNAARDFVDFAALAQHLGRGRVQTALQDFDGFYRDVYRPEAGRDISPRLQLVRQLAAPAPHDLADVDLANYKGIARPWDRWENIAAECRATAVSITEGILDA